MKTFIFKPEFEEKLNGEKIKFIENIREHHKSKWVEHCEYINKAPSFQAFIAGSFNWVKSPEGSAYWLIIAQS